MRIVEEIKKILKRETKIVDIWYYLQGMYRYRIYYSFKLQGVALRSHIKEQIDYRIKVMNPECFNRGSCIKCGCMTTALQMCNKPCEGWCYPRMMSRKNWIKFKTGGIVFEGTNLVWMLNKSLNKYQLLKIDSNKVLTLINYVQRA